MTISQALMRRTWAARLEKARLLLMESRSVLLRGTRAWTSSRDSTSWSTTLHQEGKPVRSDRDGASIASKTMRRMRRVSTLEKGIHQLLSLDLDRQSTVMRLRRTSKNDSSYSIHSSKFLRFLRPYLQRTTRRTSRHPLSGERNQQAPACLTNTTGSTYCLTTRSRRRCS